VAKPTTSNTKRIPFVNRTTGVILCVIAMTAVTGYFFSQRNTYRFSVGPGETIYRPIEIPMQRFWEHKSYAKKANLSVTCTLIHETQADDGVVVTVMDTGHKLHLMWADIQIIAAPDAAEGVRKRRFEFTIDGQGGWPDATVVIRVTGNPKNR